MNSGCQALSPDSRSVTLQIAIELATHLQQMAAEGKRLGAEWRRIVGIKGNWLNAAERVCLIAHFDRHKLIGVRFKRREAPRAVVIGHELVRPHPGPMIRVERRNRKLITPVASAVEMSAAAFIVLVVTMAMGSAESP